MPTWNRRVFIPGAIDCWMKQGYENRELVILDDGEEPIEDLIPKDKRIRYIFEAKKRCTGDKRNHICKLAAGEIICHWDDDDWSASDRISFQVDLLRKSGKPVTGFSELYFWDVKEQKAKRYKASIKGYVCGTSFCYRKDFWVLRHFRAIQATSDNNWIYPVLAQVEASSDSSHMVARIHDEHHTSRKTSISEVVDRKLLPAAFWPNEELRCRG